MSWPSLLLLLWCGIAATVAALFVGALLGTRAAADWALLPRATDTSRPLVASLFVGLIVYPLFYGLIFEALHRADARIGLLLGLTHALIAFAAGRPSAQLRQALRTAAMHLVYGITIAFLYVTP